jgi:hypothetical protein
MAIGLTFRRMTTASGTIRVRPVLFCAAVFWTREFWSNSTHA